MIKDPQEYLDEWERENNPNYPEEMEWNRLQVNLFLIDYKKQSSITAVSQAERTVCPDCRGKGWFYSNYEETLIICPCRL
jgi:hypothetical protein